MRKKLFAILMSAMMMVTFMPSMAFAEEECRIGEQAVDYETEDACKKETNTFVKTLIPATCTTKGYDLYKSDTCGQQFIKQTNEKNHSYKTVEVEPVKMVQDIINAMLAEEYANGTAKTDEAVQDAAAQVVDFLFRGTENQKKKINDAKATIEGWFSTLAQKARETRITKEGIEKLACEVATVAGKVVEAYFTNVNDVCYYTEDVCVTCGAVKEGSAKYVNHDANPASCATHFTCKKCNKTIYNLDNIVCSENATPHAHAINRTIYNGVGKDVDINVSQLIRELSAEKAECGIKASYTCTACGEQIVFGIPTSANHNFQSETLVKSTCMTQGVDVKKCADCGLVVFDKFTAKKGHNYKDVVVPATCENAGYTVKVCQTCGIIGGVSNITKPLGHDYATETILEKTCVEQGIEKVYCKNCGKSVVYGFEDPGFYTIDSIDDIKDLRKAENVESALFDMNHVLLTDGDVHVVVRESEKDYAYITGATLYFTGFGFHGLPDRLLNPIKVKTKAQLAAHGHKYGTVGLQTAATCENDAVYARKCVVCGYVDKHATVDKKTAYKYEGSATGHKTKTVVVAPTCGDEGFSYKVCEVCNQIVDLNGSAVCSILDNYKNVKPQYQIDMAAYSMDEMEYNSTKKHTIIFDLVSPKIAEGADCNYSGNYEVIKRATVFEGGCLAHKCSVCGSIKNIDLHNTAKVKYNRPVVKVSGKKATVTVKTKKDAVKYTVQYRKYGKAYAEQWKTVKTKTTTKDVKVTTKNLKPGKYNFRVFATNAAGKKAYSKVTQKVVIK